MRLSPSLHRFAAILIATTLLFAACDKPDPKSITPGEKKASDKPRIALIMKSLANEFFITMAEGATKHETASAGRYVLIVNGIKDESDLNGQAQMVRQMIAMKVDAIIIAPADSKALAGVCKEALDAGIVVVNIDNKLDAKTLETIGVAIPFVGPDNRKGARAVGDVLAAKLTKGDEVAIIEGIPTAFNSQQRRAGFEDAMQAAGMKIVGVQSGQWESDNAKTIASALVASHPALRALLCANDNMALGAASAVNAAGKNDQIAIVGFDNISAIQELVRKGRVLATADQHGDRLAVFGIEYALEILDKKTTPADKETPVDLITAETLK